MHANFRKALVAAAMIGTAPSAFADVITDWNEKTVAFVTPRMVPAAGQRVVAIVQVAMFDAVNSIERRYRPYLVQLPAAATASKEAAAAAAAGTVLAGLYPQEADLKGAMAAYLATIPDSDAKSAGIKLGEAVAAKILEARAKDGADAPDSYQYKTKPGVYVPTPITVSSTWPKLKPFALTNASQFRPAPPIALNSEQWATDYNEIKDFGGKTSSKRSARQTEDARFWLITGPQSTEPVVRQIVAAKKMSVIDSARFMALTAVAGGRCRHCGVRCQVPLRVLASDHRDPQRRYRRQSGHRARRDLAADRQYADASGISVRALHHQRCSRRCHRGGAGHGGRSRSRHDQPDCAGRHPSMDQHSRL